MKLRIGTSCQAMMDGMMKATMVAVGLAMILAVVDCDGFAHHPFQNGAEDCLIVQGTGNVIKNTKRAVILNAEDLEIDGPTYDYTLVQPNLLLTGSLRTVSVRFVGYDTSRSITGPTMDHQLEMDDHILILGKQAVLHLSDVNDTPDGMRILIRSDIHDFDGVTFFDGTFLVAIDLREYEAYPNPRISCEMTDCSISPLDGPNAKIRMLDAGVSEEYVFLARHNTWYQI